MGSNSSHRRIVVGVDGSANSSNAVTWAINNARGGDTVVLLTGWHPVIPPAEMAVAYVDDDTPMRAVLTTETEKATKTAAGTGVEIASRFVHIDPRTALIDEKSDMIVIGARGHSGVVGLLLGSTADYVSRHSTVPVVIVPAKK
ncbi:MAG: universal stress protein [Actinobacteria bacterium]|jgi:nucleotide-binding universal stress UspA family protein|nr:universal stress protein [Actinomycetota bacterium]NBR66454.1 universal stress protein [Actinomycetota bacterium]